MHTHNQSFVKDRKRGRLDLGKYGLTGSNGSDPDFRELLVLCWGASKVGPIEAGNRTVSLALKHLQKNAQARAREAEGAAKSGA
jgi:hypothetical protein